MKYFQSLYFTGDRFLEVKDKIVALFCVHLVGKCSTMIETQT